MTSWTHHPGKVGPLGEMLRLVACPACWSDDHDQSLGCFDCMGSGSVLPVSVVVLPMEYETCPVCVGTASPLHNFCDRCRDTGKVEKPCSLGPAGDVCEVLYHTGKGKITDGTWDEEIRGIRVLVTDIVAKQDDGKWNWHIGVESIESRLCPTKDTKWP